jgi:hypothetical protein
VIEVLGLVQSTFPSAKVRFCSLLSLFLLLQQAVLTRFLNCNAIDRPPNIASGIEARRQRLCPHTKAATGQLSAHLSFSMAPPADPNISLFSPPDRLKPSTLSRSRRVTLSLTGDGSYRPFLTSWRTGCISVQARRLGSGARWSVLLYSLSVSFSFTDAFPPSMWLLSRCSSTFERRLRIPRPSSSTHPPVSTRPLRSSLLVGNG